MGTGCQLAVVACACILLAILEHVYEQKGTLVDKTGVMCGTMGFIGAFFFVHKIYRQDELSSRIEYVVAIYIQLVSVLAHAYCLR